jgi:hypothetical protein
MELGAAPSPCPAPIELKCSRRDASADPAKVAVPAEQRRLDRHVIANPRASDVAPYGNDRAGELVSGDNRVAGDVELAVDDVDVGPTDAAAAAVGRQDDAIRRWGGIVNPLDAVEPGCDSTTAFMANLHHGAAAVSTQPRVRILAPDLTHGTSIRFAAD